MTPRHATAAVACALAVLGTSCSSLSSDANAPIAIEIVLPRFTGALTVEEFDTLPIAVRVWNRAGDSIPGAKVQVISTAPDTLGVDTLPLGLVGVQPGHARIIALSGKLQSDPLGVTVVRAPDSLALPASAADTFTVAATDSASGALTVSLLDLRTDTTQATGMSGYPVVFAVVFPALAGYAVPPAVLSNDSLVDTVTTAGGTATVLVKRNGPPPQPDSVIVQASAARANGTVVRGSPIRFVVRFQ